MTHPSIKMTEVESKAQEILANPDYDLDSYGLNTSAVIDDAIKEQMPQNYNEADESNLRLELGSRLEEIYDELVG